MEGRVGRRGRDGVDESGKEGKAEREGNERGEGRVVVGGSVESRRRNGGSGEGRDPVVEKNLGVDRSPEEGRSGGRRVRSGEGRRGVDENPSQGVEGGVTHPRIKTPIRTMVTNEWPVLDDHLAVVVLVVTVLKCYSQATFPSQDHLVILTHARR